MRPHQYILTFIVLIGLLSVVGGMIIKGSTNYDITPSDEFVEITTGSNYSEYQDRIEEIKVSVEDDGFLAQFKLARAVYNAASSTFTQSEAIISNIATFIGIPYEIFAIGILIVIIMAVFGLFYLIIGR